MSLASTFDCEFYHGTSQSRLESILQNGFLIGDPHYDNFLSPIGIYLVLGRPLIARRFALKTANEDGGTPVVVSLKIKKPEEEKIWDLTTDEGMHLLYVGYTEIERTWTAHKRNVSSRAPRLYTISLKKTINTDKDWIVETLQMDSKINRDSLAIKYISDDLGFEVILAAIQEGTTLNYSFSAEEPKYFNSTNYRGIRYRDHIELCVLNPILIDPNSIIIRDKNKDDYFYEDEFGITVLARRVPDANDNS